MYPQIHLAKKNLISKCGLTFLMLLKSMNQRYNIFSIVTEQKLRGCVFLLQMYFSLRFKLWLRWIDNRLGYQNLYQHRYQNKIPDELATKLWKPMIVFENSKEGKVLKFDQSSSDMFLYREGESKDAPLKQWDEARIYPSNETKIAWRSENLLKFKCAFDLHYLPFDTQTCYVKVRDMQRTNSCHKKLCNLTLKICSSWIW